MLEQPYASSWSPSGLPLQLQRISASPSHQLQPEGRWRRPELALGYEGGVGGGLGLGARGAPAGAVELLLGAEAAGGVEGEGRARALAAPRLTAHTAARKPGLAFLLSAGSLVV